MEELIKSHGYPVEVYDNIVTKDGYILTAYRIPPEEPPKPVVLLMHGGISNCGDFLISGPSRGLGFVLSNHGYDVWLANVRGKRDSLRHTELDSHTDELYWKFSFHDIALYDLPAFMDQIEKVTTLRTITYIGHSQGSTLPFVLLSERPEYSGRFNMILAFNAVVVIQNARSIPYLLLNKTRHIWLTVMEKLGILEFPPRFLTNCISTISKWGTQEDGWFLDLVIWFLHLLHGKTPEQTVKDDVCSMLKYFPDSTSAIVLKHFGQMYRAGLFRKFDYGCQENRKVYGTDEPPCYDLNNTACPVVLFCSSEDLVAVPKDVREFARQLPNCVDVHELDNFNHSDFLFGRYAAKAHPLVLDHLKKYCQVK